MKDACILLPAFWAGGNCDPARLCWDTCCPGVNEGIFVRVPCLATGFVGLQPDSCIGKQIYFNYYLQDNKNNDKIPQALILFLKDCFQT